MARRGSYLRRSCSLEYPTEHCGTQPVRPYNFTLPTCAAAAMNFSTINCPYHPDTWVSLDELIPDLLMTDLPRNLLVDSSEFMYKTDDESRLGGGGAGEVYRGSLREDEVAVKTFHSTRVSRYVFPLIARRVTYGQDWSRLSLSILSPWPLDIPWLSLSSPLTLRTRPALLSSCPSTPFVSFLSSRPSTKAKRDRIN